MLDLKGNETVRHHQVFQGRPFSNRFGLEADGMERTEFSESCKFIKPIFWSGCNPPPFPLHLPLPSTPPLSPDVSKAFKKCPFDD